MSYNKAESEVLVLRILNVALTSVDSRVFLLLYGLYRFQVNSPPFLNKRVNSQLQFPRVGNQFVYIMLLFSEYCLTIRI